MCSTPKANQQLKAKRTDNVVSILSALDEDARKAFTERANKAAEKRLKDSGYLVEHAPIRSVSFNAKSNIDLAHYKSEECHESQGGIMAFISGIFGRILHR
ncbi:hypothetical protein [Litorilituus lipolyticus]|uniref:Uncharacterized protein n=1 Tax=Litorilituus lipolyticus TaxID=2491017 RepID=A0A502KYD9_9GAMM|nr:hypothetical protein [Litorilituus lipolyticus]TPH15185.1 hypothetical protein EPA86_10240 [Litorilituus lipolyticus]